MWWLIACTPKEIVFEQPKEVMGPRSALQLWLEQGTLVLPDPRAHHPRRIEVTTPMLVQLYQDGTLIEVSDGGFEGVARLDTSRPSRLTTRSLGKGTLHDMAGNEIGRILHGAKVQVLSVENDYVSIALPFLDPAGAPLVGRVHAETLSTSPELRRDADWTWGSGGDLLYDRPVLVSNAGLPFAQVDCGWVAVEPGTSPVHVRQIRQGIELDGWATDLSEEPDPRCASAPRRLVQEDLPDGWVAVDEPRPQREEALALALSVGRQIDVWTETTGCRTFEVEAEGESTSTLVRRWSDETHAYTEQFELSDWGTRLGVHRPRTRSQLLHPPPPPPPGSGGIATVGGDPILPCGYPLYEVVETYEDRLEAVKVRFEFLGQIAYDSRAPRFTLYLSRAACEQAHGLRTVADGASTPLGGCG